MMDAVLQMLAAQGWLHAESVHSATVLLSGDDVVAHKLLIREGGAPTLFVKFSDTLDLEDEARRTALSSQRFSRFAPGYIGYRRHGNLNAIVTVAVERRVPSAVMLSERGLCDDLIDELVRFFQQQRAIAERAPGGDDWQEAYQRFFHGHPLRSAALLEFRRLLDATSGLPSQDQHGDLALNNVALSGANEVTVFDWEDYGATNVPGLDVFTMLRSIEHGLESMRGRGLFPARKHSSSAQQALLRRACEAIGMDVAAFRACRVGYMFLFRFLKTSYSPALQESLDAQLRVLVSQSRH